jgi:hypothetical protein
MNLRAAVMRSRTEQPKPLPPSDFRRLVVLLYVPQHDKQPCNRQAATGL